MLRWTLGRTSWDRLRVRSTLGSPLVENANFVVSLYLGQTRLLRKHWEELVTHAALHLEAVAPRSRRGFSVPLGAWPQPPPRHREKFTRVSKKSDLFGALVFRTV